MQCDDRHARRRVGVVASSCLRGWEGVEAWSRAGGRGPHVCSHGVSRGSTGPPSPLLGSGRAGRHAAALSVSESRHVAVGLGPVQSGAPSRHNPQATLRCRWMMARALPLARPAQPPLSSSSSQLCCALAPESKAVASQRPLLITKQPEDYYHAPSARAFQWPTYRRYFLGIPSPSGPANFLENSLLPPSATSLVGPRSFGRSC